MENTLVPCESGLFRNENTICENCSVYCYTFSNNGKKLPESCIEPCNKISTTQIFNILNNTHTGSSKTNKIIVNSTISIDNDPNSSKAKTNILAPIVTLIVVVLIVVVVVVIIYLYRKKQNNSSQRTKEGHLKKPNDSSDLRNINIESGGGTGYQPAASDSLLHSNSPNHKEIDQDSMNGSIRMKGLLNNDYSSNDTESEESSFNMPSRQLTEMINFPSTMLRQESSFGKTSYVA